MLHQRLPYAFIDDRLSTSGRYSFNEDTETFTCERWIERVSQDLWSIPYFHVVFTVPQELNEIARFNQKLFYSLLFKASAETLQSISLDKKKWISSKSDYFLPVKVLSRMFRNQRLVVIDKGKVSFVWRDYRDNKKKIM